MNKPLLITKELYKTFQIKTQDSIQDLHILHDINLTIYPGDSLAITGASGEGKSTLLHILGLLESPSSGHLEFPIWPDASHEHIRLHHIGFVFQQFHLLEDLSTLENVLLPLRIQGFGHIDEPVKKRALELLERVGLTDRLYHPASKLSGGEKQRCAIARALVRNPQLLFADEPTGNLDHDNAECIAELLFTLAQEHGSALILVTHDLRLARRGNIIFKLERGQLALCD